jgi:hypothetical protein
VKLDLKGEPAWVIVGLRQSDSENPLSVETTFEVYGVAPTLQSAKDILWDIGPYLNDNLSLTIEETTLIG